MKKKEKEKEKKFRFRCQYQKGDTCLSEKVNSHTPISAAEIILCLSTLAVKVKNEKSSELGDKVALKVLKIIEDNIIMVKNKKKGYGKSKSYYFNPTAKRKDDKSERVDLEFRGDYGLNDGSTKLTTYIKMYRQMKGWTQ